MPRKYLDLERVTIRIHSGDREKLAAYYPRLGYNHAIRKLVRVHLKALDEAAMGHGATPSPSDVHIGDFEEIKETQA